MALVFRGLSSCSVCNEVIQAADEMVAFPHVISNQRDPLWPFSDTACHAACAKRSPEIQQLAAIAEEHYRRTGPGNRKCEVCCKEILDPENCLMFGYLGDPELDELGRFNFIHIHKSHLANWKPLKEFLAIGQAAIDDGRWRGGGRYLEALLQDLRVWAD